MDTLNLNGKIWPETMSGQVAGRFTGSRRIELLRHIQWANSIKQATKVMPGFYERAGGLTHSMQQAATARAASLKNQPSFQ